MIHNFTEERKKLNRHDAFLPAPLTEEELAWLIETVEERELLHAPGHLRGNIFSRIQEGKRKERQRALFSYRAKVLVGMAAALAVLFLVPVDGTEPLQTGIYAALDDGKAQGVDEWEQDILKRQQDIDRTWERLERVDARRSYFRRFTDKFRDHADWED
ncbi:MAG: hypothetical protein OSJ69_09830 [Acetatifactor sp.]|nr:hypothetical protein [Acetatifactor sp.]